MMFRPLVTLFAAISLSSGVTWGATISLDSVTRTVTTNVLGGTSDSDASSSTGVFNERAETLDGTDSAQAVAQQYTLLNTGGAISLYTQTDLLATGSRGGGFAPVSLSSESLVALTFTVAPAAGSAGYWVSGLYTISGGVDDGSPRVEWSLTSTGGGPPTPVFAGSGHSGAGMPISEAGQLSPGTYELRFRAQVGAPGGGPTSFLNSDASGSAMIQGLSVAVSPIAPVPEPSTALLVVLGGWSLLLRRRRPQAA